MVRERGVFRVAFALLVVVGDVGLVVLVVGPLRRAPVHRRHEVVVARGHLVIGLLGRLRLGLAPARDRLEGGPDVRHLLHPLADTRKIGVRLVAARAAEIERARLVPVDAVGADDVVEEPALLLEAAHVRLAARVENRLRWIDDVHRMSSRHFSFRHGAGYSGFVLVVLRIGAQRARSSWKTPAALSGPTSSTGSKPSRSNSVWNCGSAMASWVTALMRSRIGRGVPAGANTPRVVCATMSGNPASIAVGMSGALLTRARAFTARMRILPARWRSRIWAVALAESIGICPPMRPLTACPMPLYGTCTISRPPARSLNSSPARLVIEPFPAEP